MRAWISYRPSMTLPTNGSWVIAIPRRSSPACSSGPARSFRHQLDVGVGVDLARGQFVLAVGAVLVAALDLDLAAGARLAGEVRSGDEHGPPRLRDPLIRS